MKGRSNTLVRHLVGLQGKTITKQHPLSPSPWLDESLPAVATTSETTETTKGVLTTCSLGSVDDVVGDCKYSLEELLTYQPS